MGLEGRIEKRLELSVQVCLVSATKPRGAETAFTGNVSSRGSRVVTERPWEPAEELWITPSASSFQTRAQVIYCQPLANARFAIGILFPCGAIRWEETRLADASNGKS
jgi:hypothetical protein